MQRRARRAVILQQIEGRLALRIERNDLAVEDGLIRHRLESLQVTGISAVEVVIVPRAQPDFAAGLDCQSAVAIKLELMQPILALGQPCGAEA